MRLPSQRKNFGFSSEFSVCIKTTINQGNSSVAPVLLKFANDVFAKMKIIYDYIHWRKPKCHVLLIFATSFTVRRNAKLSFSWNAFVLMSCFYVQMLLCARFTVTLRCTVHCHTYVHGPLSHLCARSTVTLMCTVHCHNYVYRM